MPPRSLASKLYANIKQNVQLYIRSCIADSFSLTITLLGIVQFLILAVILEFSIKATRYKFDKTYEPVHEKTINLGFRPGLTQTGLYSHRRC